MSCWLLKTEPGEYSYSDLEQRGRDLWDRVRNFAAQKNIRRILTERPGLYIPHRLMSPTIRECTPDPPKNIKDFSISSYGLRSFSMF